MGKELKAIFGISLAWVLSVCWLASVLISLSHDKNYAKVQGKVVGDYYTVFKKGSVTTGVKIQYTYNVNGVAYTAEHLTKDDPNSVQTVLVYYNPRDPQESYLVPTDDGLLTVSVAAFAIVSLALGYCIYKYFNPYGWGIAIS